MSLDGIWVLEVAGVYGWERISTAFLEKGRYLGGGAFSFSQGTYDTDGKKVKIKLQVTQHGEKRAIFGEKRQEFATEISARRDGDLIEGKARLKGGKSTAAQYPIRLIKLAEIPPLPKNKK